MTTNSESMTGLNLAEIADTLRRARERRGLTQVQLAERAGISHVMVGRYENAQAQPTERTIAKLEAALSAISTLSPSSDVAENPKRGLTLAEAKNGLALTFGVPPEAIEITIRG